MSDARGKFSLSVIIPVYNVDKYLRQCLDSVIPQLCAGDRVILVDDGSTDGSGAICDEYAASCDRIEVIHQRNRGVAGARNAGLARARGEYVAWIDPDDWVEPGWRKEIGAILEHDSPDIVVYDQSIFGGETSTPCHYGREAGQIDLDLLLADIVEDRIIQSGLCNKVIRRSLYEGIVFDESLPLLEDYAVLHFLVMKAGSAAYLPSCLYNYRIHGNSLTHRRGLDVSYQSFRVACRRRKEIHRTGRRCAPLGVVRQARWFLHFYYMDGSPRAFLLQSLHCRLAVLMSAPAICTQKDIITHEKIRRLFWALPGVGWLYRRRKPRMT